MLHEGLLDLLKNSRASKQVQLYSIRHDHIVIKRPRLFWMKTKNFPDAPFQSISFYRVCFAFYRETQAKMLSPVRNTEN